MRRAWGAGLVLLLAGCGTAPAGDPVRRFLEAEGAEAQQQVTPDLSLEVTRSADLERAEQRLAEPVSEPQADPGAALNALDVERASRGEPPLLFARADPSSGTTLVAVDTTGWFDANGAWRPAAATLDAERSDEVLAAALQPLGAHLLGAWTGAAPPRVRSVPGLPALALLRPADGIIEVNPNFALLVPRTASLAVATAAPSPASEARMSVAGATGGGRFDGDASVEDCITREADRCRACLTQGGCEPVFPGEDGAEECRRWSAKGSVGLQELCVAGLLERSGAATCVAKQPEASSCPFSPDALGSENTLDKDQAFASSLACQSALDRCLPSAGGGSFSGVRTIPACSSCGGCDDSGCVKTVKDIFSIPGDICGAITSSCNGNSPGSKGGCGTSGGTSGGTTTSGGATSTSGGTTTSGATSTSGGGTTSSGGATSSGGSGSSSGSSGSCGSCNSSGCGNCGGSSGSSGGCKGCSSSGAPWTPGQEAGFAFVAPVLALVLRRRR